ncbi:MAG TPA: CvpA family protein [Dehalococcoidia bacterium]|jgi:membrane protein required for colicin V production|nr:CvpA family protein [Dehalococcoidia bacterium]HIK89761.1 CvpA family protein [Dehalococcoidia bacterium]
MNALDWVLVIAFALTALWGYKTGLVNAVLNAVAIYVGLFLSGLFAGRVLSLIWDGVESGAVSTAIGYLIIFVAVFLASRIVSSIIKKALKVTFMGWIDNVGGIVIGLVAGVLISGGIMTVVARYSFVDDQAAEEINAADVMTDGIEGMKDKVTGNVIKFATNAGQKNGRELLVESTIVPSLLNLRSFVIEFAPGEFGVALDKLEPAVDEQA